MYTCIISVLYCDVWILSEVYMRHFRKHPCVVFIAKLETQLKYIYVFKDYSYSIKVSEIIVRACKRF